MALSTQTPPAADHDRRPTILVCNWSNTEPAWDLVEDLSGVPWQPECARTELVERSGDIPTLAAQLADRLINHDVRALLLIGRTKHEGPARLQLRAEIPQENGKRISPDAPGVVRSTGPAGDILDAVAKAHVSIVASSEHEPDEGSELLYDLLTRMEATMETPAVTLLRFPASMTEASIAQAVKASVVVMTQNLTPLPRFGSGRA